MEKRNFVTSYRTPMNGAADIDEIIDAGAEELATLRKEADAKLVKKACDEDEKADSELMK